MREWVYFKLYPGGFERLDVALPVVDDVVAGLADRLERWFFIRYVDESGPHLRLRLLPQDGAVGTVHDRAFAAMSAWLGRSDAPTWRTAWLGVTQSHHPYSSTTKALEPTVYEPEWTKYGGAVGVALAEELFLRSSRFALRATNLGRRPGRSRAAIAFGLMRDVLPAGLAPLAATFWSQYADFWMRGVSHDHLTPAAVSAGSDPGALAASMATLEEAVFAEDDGLTEVCAGYVQAVHRYLDDAARVTSRPAHALLFHQVHMTNNRLGVTPVEESVLARALHEEVAA